jgi:hypothetical protein
LPFEAVPDAVLPLSRVRTSRLSSRGEDVTVVVEVVTVELPELGTAGVPPGAVTTVPVGAAG